MKQEKTFGKSNLDVWAIQKDPEEVLTALKQLKLKDDKLMLFINCVSKFTIGGKSITTRQFDTILQSVTNDMVVFLQRGEIADSSDIIKYFDKTGLDCSIVVGKYDDGYVEDGEIPELWFAREKYVLEDALDGSKQNQGISECNFYPNLGGELSLGYYLETGEYIEIDGRYIQGLVETDDKMVLIINQQDPRNLSADDVLEIISANGFTCNVITNGIPSVFGDSSKKK